jgi:hypothetical protein
MQINTGAGVSGEATPSPEGHDAAMLAKFEKSQDFSKAAQGPNDPAPAPSSEPAKEPAKEDRPGWLPEKFKSPEDLAKAYQELEKKLGSAPKTPDPAPANDPAKEGEAPKETDAREAAKSAGLDYDTLSSKFAEKGTLEDGDYAALEKAGIPRGYVDQYIEGVRALAENRRLTVFNEVGGKANYEAAIEWAKVNMTQAEISAYNENIDSGDLAKMTNAARGLYSKYTQVNGERPSLVTASNTPTAGDAFRSVAELTTAMRDPRYATDEAYRRDVSDKLSRSNIL